MHSINLSLNEFLLQSLEWQSAQAVNSHLTVSWLLANMSFQVVLHHIIHLNDWYLNVLFWEFHWTTMCGNFYLVVIFVHLFLAILALLNNIFVDHLFVSNYLCRIPKAIVKSLQVTSTWIFEVQFILVTFNLCLLFILWIKLPKVSLWG